MDRIQVSNGTELKCRLMSANGESHTREIVAMFSLAGREYALLRNLDGHPSGGEAGTAVMRVIGQGEYATILQSIDDKEEFEFVVEGHLCDSRINALPALTVSSIRADYKLQVLDDIVWQIGNAEPFEVTDLSHLWVDEPSLSLSCQFQWTFASGGREYAVVRFMRDAPISGPRNTPGDLDEDEFLPDEDAYEHVGYALMRFSQRENTAIFSNIESDGEFTRVVSDLQRVPPWAPPWHINAGASDQSDPADEPAPLELSESKVVFADGIAPGIGHAASYEIAGVPIEVARDPSRLTAYLQIAVALFPTGLLSRVPPVRPSDITPEFFEQLRPRIGYARSYEIDVWEDLDPIVVRLIGSDLLLCLPPRDYRGYDLFKILGIFECDRRFYLLLLNGYKEGSSEPFRTIFVAAGYGLVRIISEGGEARVCDISSDEEFDRVQRYLREHVSVGLDCRAGAASHQSLQKQRSNEDCFFISRDAGLSVVADGFGSEEASLEIVQEFRLSWQRHRPMLDTELQQWLEQTLQKANEFIFSTLGDRVSEGKIGSTIVVAARSRGGRHFKIAHVGDSRGYLIRDGKLLKRTADHTVVGELVRAGRLTEEEARTSSYRRLLTRNLGGRESPQVEFMDIEAREGDWVLLCTKGLTSVLHDAAICEILQDIEDPIAACERLVQEVVDRGAPEDVTVVALRFFKPV